MNRFLVILVFFLLLGCKGDEKNILLQDQDYANLVDPYDKTTKCDIDSESKLLSYVKNQYSDVPFEGARYIKINDCNYMIGVGISAVRKSKSNSITNRIAKLKAQNQISSLVNKTELTSSEVVKISEKVDNDNVDYFESYSSEISSNLFGFISGMQTLTAFKSSDNSTLVYVLFQEL
tara:strand:+ start:1808 stop:2338 length:531 start_codon:yes stop_codon:yes gene_type:complete